MQSPNILVVPAYVLIVDDDSERVETLRERLRRTFREHDEVIALGSVDWLDNNDKLMQRSPVQTLLVGDWRGWDRDGIRKALTESYPDVPLYFLDEEVEGEGDIIPALALPGINPINERIRRILQESAGGGGKGGGAAAPRLDDGRPAWLFRGLAGTSAGIQSVRNDITLVAASDSTVLINGSAGTGKEIAARNIHFLSPRRLKPFVAVRCGADDPQTLEADLFGRDDGEGDPWGGRGRFELADGGTLFFDDIGAMPLSLQLRLLRVLRERTLVRSGGDARRPVNVRIIATSHQDLDTLVAAGSFRGDLRDCLGAFPIRMPELRDRIEDLPALITEVQRKLRHDGGDSTSFSAAALGALAQHSWPGNLHEFSDLVEQLCAEHPGAEIGIADLPSEFHTRINAAGGTPVRTAAPPAAHSHPGGLDLERYLADVERLLIHQALEESGGAVERAARRLNLGRELLEEKMRRYGM
jgi:DNA-binding NtrC family response regulator